MILRKVAMSASLAGNLMLFAHSSAFSQGANYDFIYNAPHKLETVDAKEKAISAALAEGIKKQILESKEKDPEKLARRDAHPKAHGCVQADFTVKNDKLSVEDRIGFLATNKTYKSWIRYSNGMGKVQSDAIPDARGMAVQVVGVAGDKSIPASLEEDKHQLQDFIMINHPAFFVHNTEEYVDFFKGAAGFFAKRPREALIAAKTAAHVVTNPLKSNYWSMVPVALGNEKAIKYAVVPAHCTSASFEQQELALDAQPAEDTTGLSNFLRANMRAHLLETSACFRFKVQIFKNEKLTPIEDPRDNWDDVAPMVEVGYIRISKGRFTVIDNKGEVVKNDQDTDCENTSITPWHSLAANKPLGSINRSRGVIYAETQKLRHDKNNAPAAFTIHPAVKKYNLPADR